MRARTSSLDSSAAGDWVSQQFLESAIYRRMKALADDPTVPLFFGRLDYTDAHEDARGERFYIGRRHVSDEFGDPMVVDWRAREGRAVFRANKAAAMGGEVPRPLGFPHRGKEGDGGEGPPPGAGVGNSASPPAGEARP